MSESSLTPSPLPREMAHFARRDDRRAFAAVAGDWAIVVMAAAIAERAHHPLAWLAAAVVIAGRQTAMLNLTHAASHRALFRRARWNEGLDVLYALPVADTVAHYRGPHLEHHREIAEGQASRFEFLHETLALPRRGPWGRTWVVFVRPLLGHAGWGMLYGTVKDAVRDRAYGLRLLAFWAPLVGVAALVGALRPLFWYWVVPLFWLHPVFLLWGEVSDHFRAPGGTRDHTGLFHAAISNGHALYHDLHHRYPFIPFYRERAAALHLAGLTSELASDQGRAAPQRSRSALDFVRRVFGPLPQG
jgi:fatty acid desaturase